MRAYTYKQLTFPSGYDLISLAEIKTYLKISSLDTSEDTLLKSMIESAIKYCESYTKRELLIKQFVTYRDCFCYEDELRRSRLTEVDSVKYYIDDVLTTLSTDKYYVTSENDFSKMILEDGESYPSVDSKRQAIEITFKAGYSVDNSGVPDDLLIGLKAHIAFMYSNRGDCVDMTESSKKMLIPITTALIYDQYRILDIIL